MQAHMKATRICHKQWRSRLNQKEKYQKMEHLCRCTHAVNDLAQIMPRASQAQQGSQKVLFSHPVFLKGIKTENITLQLQLLGFPTPFS